MKAGNKSETASTNQTGYGTIRTGLGADAIAEALLDNLHYIQAKVPLNATRNDWYMALAYTVRDRMLDRYIKTLEAIISSSCRHGLPASRFLKTLSETSMSNWIPALHARMTQSRGFLAL